MPDFLARSMSSDITCFSSRLRWERNPYELLKFEVTMEISAELYGDSFEGNRLVESLMEKELNIRINLKSETVKTSFILDAELAKKLVNDIKNCFKGLENNPHDFYIK